MVEEVVRIATENKARQVNAVTLDVGAMQQIVPESLRTAFEVVAAGTIALSVGWSLRRYSG